MIVSSKPLPNYCVWICFDDGLEGEVDLNDLVGKGVFKAWESVDFFNQVYINPKTATLTWDEDIDLDPYVLREQVLKNHKKNMNEKRPLKWKAYGQKLGM